MGNLWSKTPPRSHQCSVCGKIEPWDKTWMWFGSYQAMDEGAPLLKDVLG